VNRLTTRQLILLGLVARLAFLVSPGSPYLSDLFIPFLDKAVQNPFLNPWEISPPVNFPYGSFLLAILALPRWVAYQLFGEMALGTTWLSIAQIKIIMLLTEVLLLKTMHEFTLGEKRRLVIFYWLNPIVIYISYVHGQLDLIVSAMLAISLIQLIQKRYLLSALCFAAATLSKAVALALLPFILAFVWNRLFVKDGLRVLSQWVFVFLTVSCAGFLPLALSDNLGYATIMNPETLRLFSLKFVFADNQVLYVGLMIVLALIIRLCISAKISEDGLISGCAVIFLSLVLVTNPMPGWFFWSLPSLSLIFCRYHNLPKTLYVAFCGLYLIHFAWIWPRPELLSQVGSFTLTALQTVTFVLIASIMIISLRSEAPIIRRIVPLQIGLVGNSGAGKNYFTNLLLDLTGPSQTLAIEGDDYHKWERGAAEWSQYTHLHPAANHLGRLALHTQALRQGRIVQNRHYDHSTGRFTADRTLLPVRTLIVQGLHTFFSEGLRNAFDLKIFLKPDPTLLLYWKLNRDIKTRGHTQEKVWASIASRQNDSETFIDPQAQFADWVIVMSPRSELDLSKALEDGLPELIVTYTVPNELIVHELAGALQSEAQCVVEVDPNTMAHARVTIQIFGDPEAKVIKRIGETLFPELRQITRSRKAPNWRGGLDGIHQLFSVALLQLKMQ
jgi:uridine kinase